MKDLFEELASEPIFQILFGITFFLLTLYFVDKL